MTRKEFEEIANKLPHNCDMCVDNGKAIRCEHCDNENDYFTWKTSAIKLIQAVWDACKERSKNE